VGRRRIQKKLERKFGCQANFSMNTTLPSFSLIFMSQTVITDWSDVALQYALGLERKVVFVDLPRADGRAAGSSHRRPLEMALRNRLGLLVRPDQLSSIGRICRVLFDCGKDDTLAELREQVVFNSNVSGAVGSAALEALTLRHDPQAALERAIRELQNEGQGGENPRGLRVIRQR